MGKVRRALVAGMLLSITLGTPMAQSQTAPNSAVTAHIPKDLRAYFVAFFVTPPEPKKMSDELFIRHQQYMRRQFESGVYHLAGPLTDGGRIRGMMILTADSAEHARSIVEADPAVVENVLAVEVHAAMLPNLSGLKVEYP